MLEERALYILCSYLLGAIPFGFLIFYWAEKKDIRTLGSMNTGAANVMRNTGPTAGIVTLLLDAGKGALPVIFGNTHGYPPLWIIAAGLAVVVGHVFPVFLKFRGGKGVAAMCGAISLFFFPAFLVFLVVCLAAILATRHVSLGSVLGSIAIFFTILFTQAADVSFVTLGIVILVVAKHRSNIERLLAGSESRLHWKKEKHES